MQVIEKDVLFSQVSVEESAIFSGGKKNNNDDSDDTSNDTSNPGSYNFIGLLTYIGLGTLIWALDEALLPGA